MQYIGRVPSGARLLFYVHCDPSRRPFGSPQDEARKNHKNPHAEEGALRPSRSSGAVNILR